MVPGETVKPDNQGCAGEFQAASPSRFQRVKQTTAGIASFPDLGLGTRPAHTQVLYLLCTLKKRKYVKAQDLSYKTMRNKAAGIR